MKFKQFLIGLLLVSGLAYGTVESVTYISDLNASYPAAGDSKSEGDDHLRNLKAALRNTFPNITGAVTATHGELNKLAGATVTTAEINKLAGLATTGTELGYVAGATSSLQTQINAKAPTASPALTGTPTAPTAAVGTNTTQIASTAFVQANQGWTLLSTVTASGAATADIETTFDGTYDAYVIVASNVTLSAATSLALRMKLGGTYLTTAQYAYHSAQNGSGSSAYSGAAANAATSALVYSGGANATDTADFLAYVFNPASTTKYKPIVINGANWLSGSVSTINGVASYPSTAALTGIRFLPLSGTFSGTFRLYGIRNA